MRIDRREPRKREIDRSVVHTPTNDHDDQRPAGIALAMLKSWQIAQVELARPMDMVLDRPGRDRDRDHRRLGQSFGKFGQHAIVGRSQDGGLRHAISEQQVQNAPMRALLDRLEQDGPVGLNNQIAQVVARYGARNREDQVVVAGEIAAQILGHRP